MLVFSLQKIFNNRLCSS